MTTRPEDLCWACRGYGPKEGEQAKRYGYRCPRCGAVLRVNNILGRDYWAHPKGIEAMRQALNEHGK